MKKPAPFGKYYLLERINVGGMAEVFRAKAFGVEGFERLVAVKRILPNIAEDKEFIRMFIEEAKLAVQLNHANIAQIFDLGVVDGAYYIALEHVHGRDLRGMFDRCRQLGEAMPVSQACFIVMKVCEGLDYAHNKRDQAGRELHLVHRDVSPQNVLVSFEGEVKLIDFGIAKAAGKGSKTQAGILKGKFGYMSPEQVRGIPIDRRSDVFSCGIVLYELLTGERLFVGESDFSTLEKVRNVEILPPSTYNRRIPDELERIVLKALAKDPDERYANAIDLHDELQAFVYTAGEFYSRKDLAGWMKKTFGREIEEETAKLESYRQLKAPTEVATPPAVGRTPTGSRPPTTAGLGGRKSTQSVPSGTKPPPPPASRLSQQMPVVSAQAVTAPTGKVKRSEAGGSELAWDDDELETQIYDNPEPDMKGGGFTPPTEDDPKHRSKKSTGNNPSMPLSPPPSTPAPTLLAAPSSPGPDLSSLATTMKGWEGGPAGNPNANGTSVPPVIASGSSRGPAPSSPPPMMSGAISGAMLDVPSLGMGLPARESSQPVPFTSQPDPFDPMASFGLGMTAQKKSRGTLIIAIGGAAVAVLAVVIVIAMTGGNGADKKHAETTTTPTTNVATNVAAPLAGGDQNTGFDLYVNPPGVTTWRLDNETRTDRLPSRIRGIAPGPHQVAIDAPPGFMSQNQPVTVENGKSSKIEIVLQPIAGINGDFESTPPGATVSLIIDGKRESLGASPAKSPLDPRKTYQVLFEKPGYVSVNRPIVFTGSLDEKVVVTLEKAGAVASVEPPVPVPPTPVPPTPAMTIDHKVTPPPPTPTIDHKVAPPAPAIDHKVALPHGTTPVAHPTDGGTKVAANSDKADKPDKTGRPTRSASIPSRLSSREAEGGRAGHAAARLQAAVRHLHRRRQHRPPHPAARHQTFGGRAQGHARQQRVRHQRELLGQHQGRPGREADQRLLGSHHEVNRDHSSGSSVSMGSLPTRSAPPVARSPRSKPGDGRAPSST